MRGYVFLAGRQDSDLASLDFLEACLTQGFLDRLFLGRASACAAQGLDFAGGDQRRCRDDCHEPFALGRRPSFGNPGKAVRVDDLRHHAANPLQLRFVAPQCRCREGGFRQSLQVVVGDGRRGQIPEDGQPIRGADLLCQRANIDRVLEQQVQPIDGLGGDGRERPEERRVPLQRFPQPCFAELALGRLRVLLKLGERPAPWRCHRSCASGGTGRRSISLGSNLVRPPA